MFAFEFSPGDVWVLKFEDITMRINQAILNAYKSNINFLQQMPILK